MSSKTLIFRADASVAIGTGHLMRCLALAQAWKDDGGSCLFAVAQCPLAMEERLISEGMQIVHLAASPGGEADAAALIEFARATRAAWVVVDGYAFCAEYQRHLKNAGIRQLFIDDTGHAGSYFADLVLDQNAHATENFYSTRHAGTRLLLGSLYALLRREFRAWHGWQPEISDIGRRVLVMMGGSDPGNVTHLVIQALQRIKTKEIQATVVIGGSNPNLASLNEAVEKSSLSMRLENNVQDMAELMAEADIAISSAGTTCWEMCFLGLPAVLIDVAPNQRPIAEELHRRGVAVHLGSASNISATQMAEKLDLLLADSERRALMAKRGRELVDGRGASRVVADIRSHDLQLRPAEVSDCRLLWEWANDPQVRQASFTQNPIHWNEHVDWFRQKLRDENSMIFIATDEAGMPVGQVRCDTTIPGEAKIHISIAKEQRGKGYAVGLIDLAVRSIFLKDKPTILHAWIKQENKTSVHAFEACGFVLMERGEVSGCEAFHYVRHKDQAMTMCA